MNPLAQYLLSPAVKGYRVITITRAVRVSDIVRSTAAAHRVRVTDILCSSRNRRIVYPRHEAMYRAAVETHASYPQIGRDLGGRDHSTVIHGIRQHAKRNGLPLPRGMTPGGASA